MNGMLSSLLPMLMSLKAAQLTLTCSRLGSNVCGVLSVQELSGTSQLASMEISPAGLITIRPSLGSAVIWGQYQLPQAEGGNVVVPLAPL